MQVIPKTIHYCWFGPKPMPELAQRCIESWKLHCPDYQIVKWDESNFDVQCNRYVKEAYEARQYAFVTDYVRLHVVYHYGGIYLDTDVELLKCLDPLLGFQGFMGFEDSRWVATGLGFGAAKYNQVVYDILKDYESLSFIKSDGSMDLTPCPQRNTDVLIAKGLRIDNKKQVIDGIVVLPTDYFCPKSYLTGRTTTTSNTFAIHHYIASWHTAEQRRVIERGASYRRLLGKHVGGALASFHAALERYGLSGTFHRVMNKFGTKVAGK